MSHDEDASLPHPDTAGGPRPLHPETTAIRAGRAEGDTSLAPALYPTTTFVTRSVAEGRRMATSVAEPRFYSRYGNPTVKAFEDAVAELEGAEAARAFSSGMGAISSVVFGLCSTGDHIVTQRQLYSGTQMLFQAACPRFGIDVTFVDATEPGAFAAAVRPGKTMLIFAETPANPRLDIVDLDELGEIRGPVKVVDSTFAPPIVQRPLDHGIELSLHSATKAIGGHNDATLGVVSGSSELLSWLWGYAVLHGANAGPFDAMNGLRGLRTLSVRLERQTASAQRLAEFLVGHEAVGAVCYPGLPSHPGYEIAQRQMRLPGGLITFDLLGGLEAGCRFVEGTRIAQLATSLGGPETLVTHPASTTHVGLTPEEMAASQIGEGTIRVSVGLEHVEDLIEDFASALAIGA
jgi:cystathionine beta-lyase/cystathionine gamma-synthase